LTVVLYGMIESRAFCAFPTVRIHRTPPYQRGDSTKRFFIGVNAMNELEVFANGMSKMMTVKQIAAATNVPERTIHNAIDRLFPDIKQNGVTTYLDEYQVAAISAEVKNAHNTELASSGKVIITDIEMRQKAAEVMAWLLRDNEALKVKNAELEPKAAFFDQVADSKTALQMRDVAATLNIPGWGRNKLFEYLREKGILDNRNVPYRQFQDAGYFRVIEQTYTDREGETHISLKTLVYQRGVEYIRKMIEKA